MWFTSLGLCIAIAAAVEDDPTLILGRGPLAGLDKMPVANDDTLEEPLTDVWIDTCETMDPGNGTAQTTPCPYKVTLSTYSIIADQAIHLTLQSPRPMVFKGFVIQARDDRTGEALGEFDTCSEGVKIFNCFGKLDNSATHLNPLPKKQIELRWAPDSNDEASVTFYATIVQEVNTPMVYWVKQRVGTVHISKYVL